jgi:cell division protein FtsW (lipid II flippase)
MSIIKFHNRLNSKLIGSVLDYKLAAEPNYKSIMIAGGLITFLPVLVPFVLMVLWQADANAFIRVALIGLIMIFWGQMNGYLYRSWWRAEMVKKYPDLHYLFQ